MMKLQSISSEFQRRPTRIAAGNSICDTTNNNNNSNKSRLATSSNNASRLRCSTITKVPPANKSHLKQQIESNIQISSNSTQNQQQQQQNESNQSKFLSKLAKPTTIRARPTSLALKSPRDQQINRKTPTKVSILPKFQSKHDTNSSSYGENCHNKTSSRVNSSSELTPNNKNLSLSSKTQSIIKRKTTILRQG